MFPDHRGRDLTPFAPSSIQHMPDPSCGSTQAYGMKELTHASLNEQFQLTL